MIDCHHIDIERRSETAYTLLEKAKAGTLIGFPELHEQIKSDIVESLLLGIPVKPLMCAMSIYDGKAVTRIFENDGMISAVKSFVKGEFALSKCHVLTSLEGKRFDDLHPAFQSSIFDTHFPMYVIRDVYKDEEAVKYMAHILTLTSRNFGREENICKDKEEYK